MLPNTQMRGRVCPLTHWGCVHKCIFGIYQLISTNIYTEGIYIFFKIKNIKALYKCDTHNTQCHSSTAMLLKANNTSNKLGWCPTKLAWQQRIGLHVVVVLYISQPRNMKLLNISMTADQTSSNTTVLLQHLALNSTYCKTYICQPLRKEDLYWGWTNSRNGTGVSANNTNFVNWHV
jgi:hypothetical protein